MIDQDPPKIYYGNDPCFAAAYDPTENTADISAVINMCVKGNVVLKWRNTETKNLFMLFDVQNPIYNDEGNIIGGDYIWAQYNLIVPVLSRQ